MYELLYIIPAIYTEDELEGITQKIAEVIKKQEVEIKETKNFGKLRFAYPIKKQQVGYYILVDLDAGANALKKLNRALQLEKDVLRFMLTVKPKVSEKEKKEVEISEFKEIDPTKKPTYKPRDKKDPRTVADKEKIKLEDIDKKLDTLLEKEIV